MIDQDAFDPADDDASGHEGIQKSDTVVSP